MCIRDRGLTGGGSQGLDIVLVIDLSPSMMQNGRLNSLKKTLLGYRQNGYEKAGFIDQVLGNGTSEISNPNNRIAVATYTKTGQIEQDWTHDKDKVKGTIGKLTTSGATNYEAGLVKAQELLENRGESKNIPVVIFFSDGLPSCYNSPEGSFENGSTVGGRNSEPTEDVGDETIFVAGEFHKYMEKIQGVTYGVGFGMPSSANSYKVYEPAQYLLSLIHI